MIGPISSALDSLKNRKNQVFQCALTVVLGAFLVALFFWLSAASPAQADPGSLFVAQPPAGDDSGNDCTNSTSPCATIQHAIQVASPHDAIHIRGGVYGNFGNVAVITKPLALIGGYNETFTATNPISYPTLLEANWAGSVISHALGAPGLPS